MLFQLLIWFQVSFEWVYQKNQPNGGHLLHVLAHWNSLDCEWVSRLLLTVFNSLLSQSWKILLTFKSVLCYMDDTVIMSDSFEQHLQDIHDVLGRLESSGLKLNARKCTFATNKSVFLWHDVSRNATRPSSNRVDSIKNVPILSTVKELRCELGLLNWLRKYILHTDAIKTLKEALITSNVLSFMKFDLLFRIAEDTSSRGILYMIY